MRAIVGAALVIASSLSGEPLSAQPAGIAGPLVTAADVRFMQEMLAHHAQAVEMTSLIDGRTRRADMRALGERINISQADEMALMRRWLERHGAAGQPAMTHATSGRGAAGHDMGGSEHATMMPGMLSLAQLSALRTARGTQFNGLFLRGMIQHHEGALAMVRQLLATPAAAQNSEINRFVTDVDADQRAEIRRMRRMLPIM